MKSTVLTLYVSMAATLAALQACAAEPDTAAAPLPGLSVHDGQLLLAGKPYRGMGTNMFSLFYRKIKDPADTSYDDGLKKLSEAGIPFVRFMACGFWSVDWDLYLKDKEEYFKRLDDVVRTAEKHRIGLIPSLFWHTATVSDIVGEPLDQLGNPESKTLAFVAQYTEEVVRRYKDSSAIWGWEFGNEYNLGADLPNADKHRPPVWPTLKTASERTVRDELTSAAMVVAFRCFGETVRKFDSHRILITGNSMPRSSAYHNTLNKSWTRDTREQFGEVLLRDNPAPFDTLSVHLYGHHNEGGTTNITELAALLREVAERTGKPLFIGEFGASKTLGPEKEKAQFMEILGAGEASRAPLSAFWVFDHSGQDKDWNVTFENDRNYMLKLIAEANRRMMRPNP